MQGKGLTPAQVKNEVMQELGNDKYKKYTALLKSFSTTDQSIETMQKQFDAAMAEKAEIQAMADELVPVTDASGKCSIKINRLGDYLAVISLKGGYAVPLRLLVRPCSAVWSLHQKISVPPGACKSLRHLCQSSEEGGQASAW